MRLVLAVDRVGGRDDRASRVERTVHSRLRDRYGLLLHYFVHRHSIYLIHFIELIDTDDSPVG